MKLRDNLNENYYLVGQLLIENAEGFSPTWYNDTMGNATIGYGFKHNGYAAQYVTSYINSPNLTMPISAAKEILDNIVSDISLELINDLTYFKLLSFNSLSINKKAVLIDMAYNLGISQFLTFDTFLSYLGQGEIDEAVADLTETLWYNQVKNRAVRDCLNLYAKDNNLYLL